jgi:peptidoglycan/LPS O-acetylase OafA/YrhL
MDPSRTPYPMPEDIPPPSGRRRYDYDPLVSISVIVLFLTTISMFFISAFLAFDASANPLLRLFVVTVTAISVCLLVFGTVKLSMRNEIHWSLPSSGWLLLVSILPSMPLLDYSYFFWFAIPLALAASMVLYAYWYRDTKRTSGRL